MEYFIETCEFLSEFSGECCNPMFQKVVNKLRDQLRKKKMNETRKVGAGNSANGEKFKNKKKMLPQNKNNDNKKKWRYGKFILEFVFE